MKSFNVTALVCSSGMMVFSAASYANITTYGFTAIVESMYEYDATTNSVTNLSQSTLPGSLVSTGDMVAGTFSYDVNAPLSPYYQPPLPTSGTYQIYQSFAPGQAIKFGFSSGLTFTSSSTPLIQVANDASTFFGWDTFNLSASAAYNPVLFQDAAFNLYDSTSSVFTSSSVPVGLD